MRANELTSDPYAVLAISNSASTDEIRRAYRSRMRAVHPDTKHGDEEAAKEVNAAYALLSDPEKRRRYDAARRAETGLHTKRGDEPARCPYCGIDFSQVASPQHHIAEHLRQQFDGCVVCGRLPTAEVLYRSVAGLWLIWRRSGFNARVCKQCSTGAFREFQARTLAFGWWSYGGIFLTPYYLFKNLAQHRMTETLKEPDPNDPLIEATLKGRPVLLRTRVLIVLGALVLGTVFAAISSALSPEPDGTSATVDIDVTNPAVERCNTRGEAFRTAAEHADAVDRRANDETAIGALLADAERTDDYSEVTSLLREHVTAFERSALAMTQGIDECASFWTQDEVDMLRRRADQIEQETQELCALYNMFYSEHGFDLEC